MLCLGTGSFELRDVSFHHTIPRLRCWSREKQSVPHSRGDFLKCKLDSAISVFETICSHWSQNKYIYIYISACIVYDSENSMRSETLPVPCIHQCLLQGLAYKRFLVNKVSHKSGTVTALRAYPNCKLTCYPATIS